MDIDPKSARLPVGRRFLRTIRRAFVSGVLVTVPVMVTYFVLNFLFRRVDGILSTLVARLLGHSIPGLGLLATLLLIFLIGILARNVVGARLFGLGELIFVRTPLVRAVYSAAKQLVQAVARPDEKQLGRVVMIEYPRNGMYSIGFAAAATRIALNGGPDDRIAVFVPSTPTPVTGNVVLVRPADVYDLDMTTEEAVKYMVSGGFATPPRITRSMPRMAEV